jgi:hypothetical protein
VWLIKQPFDASKSIATNNLFVLQQNRIYLVSNNANQMAVSYLFFDYLPSNHTITTAYNDTISTQGAAFNGIPTMVNRIGQGMDSSHQIILMTLTLPKGAQDLKQTMTLMQPTTYQVIISRVIGPSFTASDGTTKPFSIQDNMYGLQQDSQTNYNNYEVYTLSPQVNANGVSAFKLISGRNQEH